MDKLRIHKFRILVGILGIFIFASAVFGAYKLGQRKIQRATQPTFLPTVSPISGETANQRTYKDDFVTFKYPSDWSVGPRQVFGSRSVVEFNYKLTPLYTLSVIGNYNQETGKPFADLDEFIGVRIDRAREIFVGAYKAKKIIDPGKEGHVIPYEEVLIFTPDNSFIISLYYEESYYDKPDANQILDQILSTFRFLPSGSSGQGE